MAKEKLIIGRKDKVDFPLLGLYNVDAKIDTGAYTSAIHCNSIRIENEDGIDFVRFRFNNNKELYLPLHSETTVKNSFGDAEKRYIIRTKIRIFNTRFPIELSMSDRSMMEYPVLIGRKLLEGRFLVDVSKMDLSYKDKIRRKRLREEGDL